MASKFAKFDSSGILAVRMPLCAQFLLTAKMYYFTIAMWIPFRLSAIVPPSLNG
jgi:hypothetical protein